MQAVVWLRPLSRMVCFHPWLQLSAVSQVEMSPHKIRATCVALTDSLTGNSSTRGRRSVWTLPSRCSWACSSHSLTKWGHRSPRTTWQINSRGRCINSRGRRDARGGTKSAIGSFRDCRPLGIPKKKSLRALTGQLDRGNLWNTLRSLWQVWPGL